MDTKHLKRRHNVYWVRVWVPEPLRGILGKSELWQNLYTTDLAEANRKKHRVVAELMEVIGQAKRDREGTLDKVSREEKLKQYALKYTEKLMQLRTMRKKMLKLFLTRLLKQKYTNYMEIRMVRK